MRTIYIILCFIIIVIFILFLYDIEKVKIINIDDINEIDDKINDISLTNNISIYGNNENNSKVNKINNKEADLLLYNEDTLKIKNKGFINELIYKPDTNLQINNDIYKPIITSKQTLIHSKKSIELPMANINIKCL